MDELEQCPHCLEAFPVFELIDHAQKCRGKDKKQKLDKEPDLVHDADFELALKLQEEERRSAQAVLPKCQLCSAATDVQKLYILDECTHRFCSKCLKNYVSEHIKKEVNLKCPLKECEKTLSVRDMKDLLPQVQQSIVDKFAPISGTGAATERIMSELKHIMKSEPERNGYSVEPVDDNLYQWELKLFSFDEDSPLGQDMKRYKKKHVYLSITFPKTYPFAPPYIRVLRPRFQFRTGHITIGGSICMEALTNKGWSPANTIEAMIVSIRAQMLAGGARLDMHNRHDYTEEEARHAFDRMVREHNW
eukprot:TRINITY_DN5184_c0_g1_i4.p1 TRINITY_DN5184_c0_g1~~TRINITY_DN5184_c0_g1_i4.p1  ORF type:complete len:305 (+),score=13.45 TRINITY_DN5184_c0_g1_i4:923-1837(+)